MQFSCPCQDLSDLDSGQLAPAGGAQRQPGSAAEAAGPVPVPVPNERKPNPTPIQSHSRSLSENSLPAEGQLGAASRSTSTKPILRLAIVKLVTNRQIRTLPKLFCGPLWHVVTPRRPQPKNSKRRVPRARHPRAPSSRPVRQSSSCAASRDTFVPWPDCPKGRPPRPVGRIQG